MEKRHINRRIEQMRAEGTRFRTGIEIGRDLKATDLKKRYDAIVIAAGATTARDLPVPGRELKGVYQAMEYLPLANKVQEGDFVAPPISAEGKHVVVIGGGDTGADCVGTAHRQGAASVTQLEIMPRPGEERDAVSQPWPTFPMLYKVTSAHEEGGERVYSVSTTHFEGDEDGNVQWLHLSEVEFVDGRLTPKPGTERKIPAQLVTLAMGFTGTDRENGLVEQFGLELDARGNVARDADFRTNVPGVYVAGDAGRGQSLIVWAIAEGRSAARGVDRFLTGTSELRPRSARRTVRCWSDGPARRAPTRPVQRRTEHRRRLPHSPRPDDRAGAAACPRTRRFPARRPCEPAGAPAYGTSNVSPYTSHRSGGRRPRLPSRRNRRCVVSTREVSMPGWRVSIARRRASRKASR